MTVTVKKERPKVTKYKVKGATLQDVWKDILKKGPKDPNDNKKVAALTTTKLEVDAKKAKFKSDGAIIENSDGTYTVKAKFDKFQLVHRAETKYPDHDGKLAMKPLIEWGKFVARLIGHEGLHVKKSQDEADLIAKEIAGLRGEATNDEKRQAARDAAAELLKLFARTYNEKKLDDRLNGVHSKFDKSSGHGPKLNLRVV